MIKVWDYKKEYEIIREDVLDAVDSVFSGGTLVFGPKVEEFETIIETGWNDKKESNNKSNNKSNNESKNSLLKIIRTLTCNYYNDEDIDKDKDKNKDNYDISLAKKSMKRKINN